MSSIHAILPGRILNWCGLSLHRDDNADCFRTKNGDFEWEVDVTLDEDKEYAARVAYQGVKVATGKGSTRPAALTKTLQRLTLLETKIANEAYERREGARAFKNHQT